jgi:hypothetical protein
MYGFTVYKSAVYSLQRLHDELVCLRASQSLKRVIPHPENPVSVSFLSFVSMSCSNTSGMLSGHNIKSVDRSLRKIINYTQPVKDDFGLMTLGVNRVPFKCGHVYIGQTSETSVIFYWLHDATSQKVITFILATVRT